MRSTIEPSVLFDCFLRVFMLFFVIGKMNYMEGVNVRRILRQLRDGVGLRGAALSCCGKRDCCF